MTTGIPGQLIEEMVGAIVREAAPRRIYLFGSCAVGRPRPDSDVDLLIVEDEDFGPRRSRWDELNAIRAALRRYRVPKDILVFSNHEFERWCRSPNHIVGRVASQGRMVYERP